MADPATIASGVDLARSGLQLLEYLRNITGADVISGYFKYDGSRIEGSSKIEIGLHPHASDPAIWWYSVKGIDDYVFLREPVNPSCTHELVGTLVGEKQPDSRFWRWVAPVMPGRIYGGSDPANIKVDFLVFGYRPRALLRHFGESEERAPKKPLSPGLVAAIFGRINQGVPPLVPSASRGWYITRPRCTRGTSNN